MDKTALVTLMPDIEGGKRLLKGMDVAGLDVRAALWLYLPEPQRWRMIVAFPSVAELGPKKSYQLVQNVLEEMRASNDSTNLSLRDISVVRLNDDLIKLFGGNV